MQYRIPSPVLNILSTLEANGFEAFIVGGCVRDLLLGREPKDWDVTTNAKPNETLAIFPDSFYENNFGTVGVKTKPFLPNSKESREHDIVEVTTYRAESGYSDKRRPDRVAFVSTLQEDLSRRDFTINAIAAKAITDSQNLITNEIEVEIIDPFKGLEDINEKVIRTVGNANERFSEDALRMMRAVRFYAELRDPKKEDDSGNWTIDDATLRAIEDNAAHITRISWERIRDEFSCIILSKSPAEGITLLQKVGLLRYILPELEEGIGVTQNLHHIYTVWEHNLLALKTCPSHKLSVRLAALLHDVAKPRTKRGEGYHSTFYNHDHVGARMTREILRRLRYPKEIIEHTALLVDNHLFYYNVGEVTEASVRRLIRRVGLENIKDLMDVRIGDRLGSGVPKAKPYKLRHLEYMIEKVSSDPLSVKMLAVKGTDLIESLGIKPGPMIGAILDILLSEVIEDPKQNTKDILLKRAKTLSQASLEGLRKKAKETIQKKREEEELDIKKRHWVE